MKLWRIAVCGPVLMLAAGGARADVASALRALDRGDGAAASAELGAEIARLSFYQALAEQGDARKAAAERASNLAAEGSWVREAASALLRSDAAPGDDSQARAEAIAGYERALEAAPNEARVWRLLADLRARNEDRAGAKDAYQRATAIEPAYVPALIGLGNELRREGDFQSAYNAFNHAVSDAPESVEALLGRAAARLYFGDQDGALGDLDSAALLAPPGGDRYRALMGILYVHTFLRDLPRGLDRAEEAVQMWGDLGRADMVAAAINAAARVQLETGSAEAAEGWYDRGWQAVQSSAMKPEERIIWQVRWLHGKARCAASRRDIERANGYADQARTLMASDPANREHYAWIGPYLDGYLAVAQRRYEEAISDYQRSDLERPHIRLLLADAYARNRDRDNARLWYQRALDAANGIDSESVIVRPLAAAWLAKNR